LVRIEEPPFFHFRALAVFFDFLIGVLPVFLLPHLSLFLSSVFFLLFPPKPPVNEARASPGRRKYPRRFFLFWSPVQYHPPPPHSFLCTLSRFVRRNRYPPLSPKLFSGPAFCVTDAFFFWLCTDPGKSREYLSLSFGGFLFPSLSAREPFSPPGSSDRDGDDGHRGSVNISFPVWLRFFLSSADGLE